MSKLKNEFYPKIDRGSITLSDKVRVSDPCYDIDTGCAGTIDNVKPGEYECFEFRGNFPSNWDGKVHDDHRVAAIEIRHKDCTEPAYKTHLDIDVGVDSGQAGFYDQAYFEQVKQDEVLEDEWYSKVCGLTYKTWVDSKNIDELLTPEVMNQIIDKLFINKDEEYRTKVFAKSELELLDTQYARCTGDADLEGLKFLIKNVISVHDPDYEIKRHSETRGDTIDNKGFVSSSGFGDGGYDCFVSKNDAGQIDAMLLVYIWPEKDDIGIPKEFLSTGYDPEQNYDDEELDEDERDDR